jgi:FeS assembly SUF system regulator
MIRISKLADYSVVVLVRLGAGGIETAPGIAQATGVPEPTVAKVLKALAGAGLVASQRGAHGGYRLARPLHLISVAEVVTAIEGPIALTACVEHSPSPCEAECCCPVRGRWDPVNTAVREALESVTLAQLAAHPARPARQAPMLTQIAN